MRLFALITSILMAGPASAAEEISPNSYSSPYGYEVSGACEGQKIGQVNFQVQRIGSFEIVTDPLDILRQAPGAVVICQAGKVIFRDDSDAYLEYVKQVSRPHLSSSEKWH